MVLYTMIMVIGNDIQGWKDIVLAWLKREDRSQSWLSRRAGLNPNYLSALLNDIRRPGIKALTKLEDAMDMRKGTLVEANAQVRMAIEAEEGRVNGHAD